MASVASPGQASAPEPQPAPAAPARSTPLSRAAPGALSPGEVRTMVLLRPSILAGYATLQKLSAHCANQAGTGAGVPTVELQFETLDGQIRVADAQPQPPGAVADPRAVCAAEAMRGATLPAPQAVAGSTFRMPFSIASARKP